MEPGRSEGTDELGERIGTVLAAIVGPERAAGIDADTNLVDEVMLDSIQMIAFLLRVEDELDVEVDFESLGLDHVRTLRSFTDFLMAGEARPV
jgi:acyl carrier protein